MLAPNIVSVAHWDRLLGALSEGDYVMSRGPLFAEDAKEALLADPRRATA